MPTLIYVYGVCHYWQGSLIRVGLRVTDDFGNSVSCDTDLWDVTISVTE